LLGGRIAVIWRLWATWNVSLMGFVLCSFHFFWHGVRKVPQLGKGMGSAFVFFFERAWRDSTWEVRKAIGVPYDFWKCGRVSRHSFHLFHS
jgi:hypothetical protein